MVLTLIAEVLSGEILVTPGGCVDMATATGMEAFTWDGWLDQLAYPPDEAMAMAVEVEGAAFDPAQAPR